VAADSFELVGVPSRLGERESFILKNTKTDRFILLTAEERFLWDRMDGSVSLQDMATAYVLTFGAFDFDLIPRLIRKLQAAQLLQMHSVSRLRRALERNRDRRAARMVYTALTGLERINISSRNVQPFFKALYRWGGFLLFTPWALLALLILTVAGIGASVSVWRNAEQVARGLGEHPVWALLCVKLLLLATIAVHQLVHGLACVHYGRRVREFGFTFLHGIVPTFYVDVTDIFMTSRRGRLVTAVSGTLVHLALGAMWFVVAVSVTPGFWQAFAAASGVIQWQTFVIALYPFCFIEMDGYHVLVDMLGVPTLKAQAFAYVGSIVRGRARWPLGRQQALYLAYIALSAISVGAFVAFNVKLILHAMS
jgi:putative peptide zinc metalloprotease protein